MSGQTLEPSTLAAMQAVELERGQRSWYFFVYREGREHLGAVVLEACGPADAALSATAAGLDPGRGSVVMTTLTNGQLPPVDKRGRLLTEAEVAEWQAPAVQVAGMKGDV